MAHPLPLIGITAGNDPVMPGHYILRWDYVHAITAAGGLPVILSPVGSRAEQQTICERLDALVLTGGLDIDPGLYDQPAHPATNAVTLERDRFELELVSMALARDLPLLGICRGMQMINLALGGDLVQDIPGLVSEQVSHNDPQRPRDALAHPVQLEPHSQLAGICGCASLNVNSFHHQAVGKLGNGVEVTARAEDGVVEGLELPDRRFVLGVQWHPESRWQQEPTSFGFFQALTAAAA